MTEIIFDKDEDWKNRILCSDESCIGTIGSDSRCRECGKIYEGNLTEGYKKENSQTITIKEQKQVSVDMKSDDDWDKRVLCSDESCIGTIGSDGKCKE